MGGRTELGTGWGRPGRSAYLHLGTAEGPVELGIARVLPLVLPHHVYQAVSSSLSLCGGSSKKPTEAPAPCLLSTLPSTARHIYLLSGQGSGSPAPLLSPPQQTCPARVVAWKLGIPGSGSPIPSAAWPAALLFPGIHQGFLGPPSGQPSQIAGPVAGENWAAQAPCCSPCCLLGPPGVSVPQPLSLLAGAAPQVPPGWPGRSWASGLGCLPPPLSRTPGADLVAAP